jgi:hypothetical protein
MRVTLCSEDGKVSFHFHLDFTGERLHFDINDGIFWVPDDGSAKYAENQAELARFFKEYVGNGQLQFFNADTGALLSRKESFVPVNCWLNVDGANANIERWKKLQAERSETVVAQK